MGARVFVRCTCLLLLLGSAVAPLCASNVRPISDAERAAVGHALAYLNGGPEALVKRLSPTSPLQKLGPAEAAKEIEVRLGPPGGATWELQTVVGALSDKVGVFDIGFPSGVDETATFELTKNGSDYLIENIRILAEESLQKPVFPPLPKEPEKQEQPFPADNAALALGLIACVAGAGSVFARRSSSAVATLGISAAALLGAGGLAIALLASDHARVVKKPAATQTAAAASTDTFPQLASLLSARRAMASGAELSVVPSAQKTEVAKNVAQLWKAQMDLAQMRTADAKRALARFPVPSTIPMVEILRARAALFEQDETAAAFAYEHAVSLGPGRDGLWAETAHALLALGFEDRGMRYLNRLDRIGSRDADVYYMLSMYNASRNHEEDAEKLLSTAWSMQPARRADIVGAQILWSVIRKPAISTFINLSNPEESTVTSPKTGSRAIDFPNAAMPRVSGEFLDVQIGDEELRVPGGACLAPPGTPAVDAATWSRTEQEKGVQDFTRLVNVASTAGAYTQPVLRRRIVQSAVALAERNRWADLVKLTDGITPKSEFVPPTLFFLRATALERLQRTDEAKQLLMALAAGKVLQRKRDVRALEELGEMLASLDLYDAAVKMLDKAQSIKQSEMVEYTVAQIQMNKRLATKYSTLNSGHFEIHYPEEVPPISAKLIGDILEAELKRMQSWVPTPEFKPVVVNIVWWQDFRSTITGSDFVLGLYQGKITVPLAGVPIYPPEIVAILTHELCHAMLAQATADQAPRWFQEGMARRVEMVGLARNAFNMYDDSKLLAVSLLDPVMRDSPDPEMIGEGYLVAEAAIRFIESKYGRQGLAKMVEQFRNGATTEQAIQALTGAPVAEFDRQFRAWGRSDKRVFESPIVARYDNEEEPTVLVKGAPLALQPVAASTEQQAPQRGKLGGGTLYPMKRP